MKNVEHLNLPQNYFCSRFGSNHLHQQLRLWNCVCHQVIRIWRHNFNVAFVMLRNERTCCTFIQFNWVVRWGIACGEDGIGLTSALNESGVACRNLQEYSGNRSTSSEVVCRSERSRANFTSANVSYGGKTDFEASSNLF